MPLKLKESVTLFLSVRRGLESCLLNEIKQNPKLNAIERIHFRRVETPREDLLEISEGETTVPRIAGVCASRVSCHGNEKWLHRPNVDTPVAEAKEGAPPSQPKIKHLDKCTIRFLSGGLEVKCNRKWFIDSVLSLRTVESVWLRVGAPFRCHHKSELIRRISSLPWSECLPNVPVDDIPLRIISKHSSVWSSVVIKECVREGIRSYRSKCPGLRSPISIEQGTFCISVTLSRNTCYLAVQCSSRLSPRLFNLVKKSSIKNLININHPHVPFWSLTKTRLDVHLQAKFLSDSTDIKELRKVKRPESVGPSLISDVSSRLNYIQDQTLVSSDGEDTADVLIAGFLHVGGILKAIRNRPLKIWNPFCGNGLLISEIISLALQLPNFTLDHPPSSRFRDLAIANHPEAYQELLEDHLSTPVRHIRDLQILGSEESALKLHQTKLRLDKLYSFYRNVLPTGGIAINSSSSLPSFFTNYRNRLPIDISLHQGDLGSVSHLMYGSMVIAKIPCMNKGAGKEHTYKTIRAYRSFGDLIGSRKDWKGVLAIVKGNAFENFSGLEWHCIAKAINSRGGVTRLLRWRGRVKSFTTSEQKGEQLDELEFI